MDRGSVLLTGTVPEGVEQVHSPGLTVTGRRWGNRTGRARSERPLLFTTSTPLDRSSSPNQEWGRQVFVKDSRVCTPGDDPWSSREHILYIGDRRSSNLRSRPWHRRSGHSAPPVSPDGHGPGGHDRGLDVVDGHERGDVGRRLCSSYTYSWTCDSCSPSSFTSSSPVVCSSSRSQGSSPSLATTGVHRYHVEKTDPQEGRDGTQEPR